MKLSKLGIFKKNKEKKSESIQENVEVQSNKEKGSESIEGNVEVQSNKENGSEPIQENAHVQNNKVFQLNKISCSSCGATVNIEEGQTLVTCPFCRNQFQVIEESPDFTIDRGVLVKYNGEDREVEVPNGVNAIGILAFHQQSTLTKIILPEGVNELQGLFFNCSNLETIILPDSLENIPSNAFTNCVSLNSILLPKNLKFLGDLAFYNCKSLTSIEIPINVESLEATTFMDCENLKTISYYEQTKINGDYFVGCDNLISLNMLDSETKEIISEKKIIKSQNGYYEIEK